MLIDFLIGKLTEESYPNVQLKRCIQFNKIPQECGQCKDICPKDAITLKSGKIEFDEKLCNKCGICKVICPTQAISINGLGEENILRSIKDKDSIIFACSKEGGTGTLKLNCLNAFHPELLAALFILYEEKKFYFNISKCKNCKVNSSNDLLIISSINKAEKFVKLVGVKPQYEIITLEDDISKLPKSIISRRELLSLIKKESSNIVTQTIDTVISDKENNLLIRKILLNALEKRKNSIENTTVYNAPFFGSWDVDNNCDGCGICQSLCPGEAWKVEKDEEKLSVYHNSDKCYNCGVCVDICTKRAIVKGALSIGDISLQDLKREINLTTCSLCNKKFVSSNKEICSNCEKREALRRKIAAI